MIFTESLRKNSEFGRVYRSGKSRANYTLVLYVKENGTAGNRLGISVSKKVGNSVVRHRVKRIIKEAYRLNEKKFISGLDMVFIARNPSKDKSFKEIEKSVLHIAGKMDILRGPKPRCKKSGRIKMGKKIVRTAIRFYQANISPYKGKKCPYIPTCSNYALEAVEKYGVIQGGMLALWRILRCNPFSHGGYDPVP